MSTASDRLTQAAREMRAVVNAERRYVTVTGESHFRDVMEGMKAKGWTFLTMQDADAAGSHVVVFVPEDAFTLP